MSAGNGCKCDDEAELRRGPWTLEEDTLLIHYIACHGEGRWNLLARCSGLKRTGKSCRLRWLNYLKPDVKRGNLTPEEQILILELHSKWGNRWSRIAQHLPGRTDNEIKNYWRTRVQKQARQLKIDANSTMFRDAVRCLWMPRLMEKMGPSLSPAANLNPNSCLLDHGALQLSTPPPPPPPPAAGLLSPDLVQLVAYDNSRSGYELLGSENCSPCISSDSMAVSQLPSMPEFSASTPDAFGSCILQVPHNLLPGGHHINNAYGLHGLGAPAAPMSASGGSSVGSPAADYSVMGNSFVENFADCLWSMDELWRVRGLHDWEN
ncbi:hypothetical protein Taro_031749 [Colocasia esculenta]|uniref:Uncharacterized protein n=1 Tax=Colocasia esculenta TaxID=4460 RepID=A0A843VPP6_COLES|nr:hypothetical protein [Colocasia esculenta]